MCKGKKRYGDKKPFQVFFKKYIRTNIPLIHTITVGNLYRYILFIHLSILFHTSVNYFDYQPKTII